MRFSGFSKETLASMFPDHEKRGGVFVDCIVRCGAIAESDGVILEKWKSFRYLSFDHFFIPVHFSRLPILVNKGHVQV